MDVIAKENSTGKVYVSGFDRQGRPIVVMRPRKENTHDHDGNIKHIVYQVQTTVKCYEAPHSLVLYCSCCRCY